MVWFNLSYLYHTRGGGYSDFDTCMPESTPGGSTETVQNKESTLGYFVHFLPDGSPIFDFTGPIFLFFLVL